MVSDFNHRRPLQRACHSRIREQQRQRALLDLRRFGEADIIEAFKKILMPKPNWKEISTMPRNVICWTRTAQAPRMSLHCTVASWGLLVGPRV